MNKLFVLLCFFFCNSHLQSFWGSPISDSAQIISPAYESYLAVYLPYLKKRYGIDLRIETTPMLINKSFEEKIVDLQNELPPDSSTLFVSMADKRFELVQTKEILSEREKKQLYQGISNFFKSKRYNVAIFHALRAQLQEQQIKSLLPPAIPKQSFYYLIFLIPLFILFYPIIDLRRWSQLSISKASNNYKLKTLRLSDQDIKEIKKLNSSEREKETEHYSFEIVLMNKSSHYSFAYLKSSFFFTLTPFLMVVFQPFVSLSEKALMITLFASYCFSVLINFPSLRLKRIFLPQKMMKRAVYLKGLDYLYSFESSSKKPKLILYFSLKEKMAHLYPGPRFYQTVIQSEWYQVVDRLEKNIKSNESISQGLKELEHKLDSFFVKQDKPLLEASENSQSPS